MIGEHWKLSKTFSGENHQSNLVDGTIAYKFGSHLFGSFQTVGLKIVREHASTHVHAQHNINSFSLRFVLNIFYLRSCKCKNQAGKSREPKPERKVEQII